MNRLVLPAFLLLVVLLMTAGAAGAPNAEYLSDSLSDRISSVTQGWGELGFNTAVRSADQPAMKLRIKDKEYAHGLGHHANGEIVVDLGGQFKTFQAEVGVQWQGGKNAGSVVFQISSTSKKVFDSGVVRENDPPRPVTVSVEGADELRLVVNDAGKGITGDCADWADARLIRDPAARKKPAASGRRRCPLWPGLLVGSESHERDEGQPGARKFPPRTSLLTRRFSRRRTEPIRSR